MRRIIEKEIYDKDGVCKFRIADEFQLSEPSEIERLRHWFEAFIDDSCTESDHYIPLVYVYTIRKCHEKLKLFDDVY